MSDVGRLPAALLSIVVLLAACGQAPTPDPSTGPSSPPSASPAPTAGGGGVIPAPGSSSAVYAPNPAAVVVAIDPGHGGCLDWGVPDPSRRGEAYAEKTMTLAIGLELRRLLEEQGVTVVLTREADVALAGDDYPDLDCHGPGWRDVNGDGQTGFQPDDAEGAIRTRDELQARLDLANVARADAFVSIHINSLTQDGVVFEIAATETFYTDETAWGAAVTQGLAEGIQREVVAAMDGAAAYERQDRGTKAHNLYVVAPPLLVETPERPDRRKQPTRGALMPSILTEVGSITLAAEQDLLASPAGQAAAAQGIFRALAAHFAARPLAVRYALPSREPAVPAPVDGDGPPFWVPTVDGRLTVRLTNSGTLAWPEDVVLLGGWDASDQPYLRLPPPELAPLAVEVPALAPGESVDVVLDVRPPPGGGGRQVGWFSLAVAGEPLSEVGSPPLQLAWAAG